MTTLTIFFDEEEDEILRFMAAAYKQSKMNMVKLAVRQMGEMYGDSK